MFAWAGSAGATVALRLLKERADSAEVRAAAAMRQVAELKASLDVNCCETSALMVSQCERSPVVTFVQCTCSTSLTLAANTREGCNNRQ